MLFTQFLKRHLPILSIILFFYSAQTIASINKHSSFSCPNESKLRQLADQTMLSIPRIIGVSIAISHPTCGDFNYTYGESNISTHTPMSDITKLPIASNTKPVLLVLTLMLMEEYPNHFPAGLNTKLTDIRDKNNKPIFTADGKVKMINGSEIDLVDPEFFKLRTGRSYDCKKDTVYQCPNLAEIDLHHLLLESSGLADYMREIDLSHDHSPDMLKFALSKLLSPLSDPGSKEIETDIQALKKFGLVKKSNPDPIIPTQSHNTDASLLAIILERVSDQSLNELLEQKILNRLGLEYDSMRFVTKPSGINEPIARQYALLNTDDEIEIAISTGKLFSILNQTLARQLKPSFLDGIGRHVYRLNATQSAIDVLDLHGQGIFGFPGPGGIIAQPKAYIKFYQALATGKLLSAKAQSLFNASFIPQASSSTDYTIATGYESNDYIQWIASPKSPTFLNHGGFVVGGESLVMHNYETGLTIMVATNTSGSWRTTLPLLFVTPTSYFDKNVIWNLEMKFAELFNVFYV